MKEAFASAARPANEAARLRQLEALSAQQRESGRRLEAALAEASGELRRLQDSNSRSVEATEKELLQLAEGLQGSLGAQHRLHERLRFADEQAAELAGRTAELEAERDRAEGEARDAEEDLRHWQAVLDAEQAEKARVLAAAHRARVEAEQLEAAWAHSEGRREALRNEVEALRRQLSEAAGRREIVAAVDVHYAVE